MLKKTRVCANILCFKKTESPFTLDHSATTIIEFYNFFLPSHTGEKQNNYDFEGVTKGFEMGKDFNG